jgi:hypothetical protein
MPRFGSKDREWMELMSDASGRSADEPLSGNQNDAGSG